MYKRTYVSLRKLYRIDFFHLECCLGRRLLSTLSGWTWTGWALTRTSSRKWRLAVGLNHLPYLVSISVSMAVIIDFSTNFMKALGLNQAYMVLKLRNNYYIVLMCSFGSIKGIYYSSKQNFYMFFLYLDNTDYFRLILKTIRILKTIFRKTNFCGFLLIYLRIFWI